MSAGEPYYTARLHQPGELRAPERDGAGPGLVVAGAAAASVHPGAQFGRRRLLDRRVPADGARRQGIAPRRRQQPAGSAVRLLLRRRLPAGQSLSGRPGRRQCSRVRRADDRTRPAVCGRQQQGVRLGSRQRVPLQPDAERQQHRLAEGRSRRADCVAGLRHRARHAGDRRPGAAVRRRRERRLREVRVRRDHDQRESGEQYLPLERQRVEGQGRTHAASGRRVPVRPGRHRSQCAVQRDLLVPGHGDRVGFRGLPARRAERVHSGGRHTVLHPQQIRRCVRTGQLAHPAEPDAELRRPVRLDGAVVRQVQPDPDVHSGPAVGGLSDRARRIRVSRGRRHSADAVAGSPQVLAARRHRVRARRSRTAC